MNRLSSLSRSLDTRQRELAQARKDLVNCESLLEQAQNAALAAVADPVRYRKAQKQVKAAETERARLIALVEQFSRTLASVQTSYDDAMHENAVVEYRERVANRRELIARSAKGFLRALHEVRCFAEDLDGVARESKDDAQCARSLGVVPETIDAVHYIFAEALRAAPDCVVSGIMVGMADTLPRGTVSDLVRLPELVPGDASRNLAQRVMLGDVDASKQLAKATPRLHVVPAHEPEIEVPAVVPVEPSEPAADEWRLVASHPERLMGIDVDIHEFALGTERAFAIDNGDFEPGEQRTGGAHFASRRGIDVAKITCDSGRSFLYQPRSYNFEPLPSGGYRRVPCERVEALELKPTSAE